MFESFIIKILDIYYCDKLKKEIRNRLLLMGLTATFKEDKGRLYMYYNFMFERSTLVHPRNFYSISISDAYKFINDEKFYKNLTAEINEDLGA